MAKILIVEDEQIIALDLQARLRQAGYEVLGAVSSGEEALKRVAAARPDLVLMDITLAGKIDGVQAGRLLRDEFHIPVIYLTARVDEATMQRAKITHPFGYLVKPYDEKTLHRTIQMALHNHEMERKLKESEERFRASEASLAKAQEVAHLGNWELDLHDLKNMNANDLRWSDEVYRLLGYAPRKIKPSNEAFFRAVHPDDRPKIQEAMARALAEKTPYSIEHRVIWADGSEHWMHERSAIVYGPGRRAVKMVGTVQDITERRQAEEKLKELNRSLEQQVASRTEELVQKERELEQTRKLEAVGRLAGGVAHDFNNIMTGILGISQDLQKQLPPEDPKQVELEEIIKASNRAFAVTKQLLAFGRKQVIRPRVIDPNGVVLGVNKLLERLIGEDIRFQLALGEIGPVKVDPTQLEQVILNLAINARDAMPEGGTLSLRTAEEDFQDTGTDTGADKTKEKKRTKNKRKENHPSAAPGRYVMLEVADTGLGMSANVLAHVFEPFFTTKDKDKGTGLGLSTVYGIVQQCGGHIRVSSQPHKGTSFKVYFPRVDGQVEPLEPAKTSAVEGAGETILVVEDEDIVRRVVVKRLRKKGYTILEARNGQEAIALCGRTEKIDLILTDIIMPEMNGREVVDQARQKHPHTAVIYMSGYPEDIIAHRGILEPGINFVEKSSLSDQLAGKVREVLDKSRNQQAKAA